MRKLNEPTFEGLSDRDRATEIESGAHVDVDVGSAVEARHLAELRAGVGGDRHPLELESGGHERRDAAEPVAAHLRTRAVEVDDRHGRDRAGVARTDEENPVGPDARATVTKRRSDAARPGDLGRERVGVEAHAVEHDEVVAEPLDLREPNGRHPTRVQNDGRRGQAPLERVTPRP